MTRADNRCDSRADFRMAVSPFQSRSITGSLLSIPVPGSPFRRSKSTAIHRESNFFFRSQLEGRSSEFDAKSRTQLILINTRQPRKYISLDSRCSREITNNDNDKTRNKFRFSLRPFRSSEFVTISRRDCSREPRKQPHYRNFFHCFSFPARVAFIRFG